MKVSLIAPCPAKLRTRISLLSLRWSLVGTLVAVATVAACSQDKDGGADGGTGASTGTGTGSGPASGSGTGGQTGSGGSISVAGSAGSAGSSPSDAGFDACTGAAHEQEEAPAPLDLYFIFDRTGSMLDDGDDCAYVHGQSAPESSKACYATYALSDYLIDTDPKVDTRFAFQFMTLSQDDCDGVPYATPLVPLQQLPLAPTDPLIQTISDEDFDSDTRGTHIEGALRGLAQFTANPANRTPGREMIGVLMTDGEPNDCEEDIPTLAEIIADHYAATGIKTFIIGMEGAIDEDLELLGRAGGAEPHDDYCGEVDPPCHYWNVEDGSDPTALSSALQAIIEQSAPLPCDYPVADLEPPAGEVIDFSKVNLTLTQAGVASTIGWVPDAASCPTDVLAWYYDNPTAPMTIHLCPNACDLVTASQTAANITVVLGCTETTVVPVK